MKMLNIIQKQVEYCINIFLLSVIICFYSVRYSNAQEYFSGDIEPKISDEIKRLCPKNGTLLLEFNGELKTYYRRDLINFQNMVIERLESLVWPGLKIVSTDSFYNKASNDREVPVIGVVKLRGSSRVPDTRFKNRDVYQDSSGKQIVTYYNDTEYEVNLNVKLNPIKYKKRTLSFVTSWEKNYKISEHSGVKDILNCGYLSNDIWDEIPDFRYANILYDAYIFTGLTMNFSDDRVVYLEELPETQVGLLNQRIGFHLEAFGAVKFPFWSHVSANWFLFEPKYDFKVTDSQNGGTEVKTVEVDLNSIEISSGKDLFYQFGIIGLMAHINLGFGFSGLGLYERERDKLKMRFFLDSNIILGGRVFVRISKNLHLSSGIKAIHPLLNHEGSIHFSNGHFIYQFNDPFRYYIDFGIVFDSWAMRY